MAESSAERTSANAPKLKLVATHAALDHQVDPARETPDACSSTNYFKSVQWSADGTSVITNSADSRIRTFILPPELLDERPEPIPVEPYAAIISHEPTDAVSVYPGYNLQDVSTTLILSAVNDHPIRLNSALTSTLVASYPLIHPTTEAYIKPHCLTFINNGSQFVAGSDSLISTFDLSRPGQEPVSLLATGSKNRKTTWKSPGTSMRGIVSALSSEQRHNVLAAGTLTRHVGLYDPAGSEGCLGVFTIQDTEADQHIGGKGITQLLWSPCGRYLYIAERKSQGLLMYDIRKTGQLLGWLEGRKADTNQRLGVELGAVSGSDESGVGHEIWAGGTDGLVKVWSNPHNHEGAISIATECHVHNDNVGGVGLHQSGSVLATVSGQRHFPSSAMQAHNASVPATDPSLKLWYLKGKLP